MCEYLNLQGVKTTKNPIGDPMRYMLFAVLLLVGSTRGGCPNVGFRRRLHLGLDRPGKLLLIPINQAVTTHYTAKSSMASGALRRCLVADPPFNCARR